MTPSSTRLVTLLAVVSLVLATIPSAAVAADLTVTTGNATNITAATAKLHGDLTSTGGHDEVNVSFEYWIEGDFANASSTTDQTLTEAGEFNKTVTGLQQNTTYVFRAKAEADGTTATGDNVTFTTDARGANPTPFGLQLVEFIRNLGGDDMIGPAVANYSTSNNPGNDSVPDHAGPPDWLMDAIVGSDGGGPGAQAQDNDGPPEHAGTASDNGDGPPEDAGKPDTDGEDDEDEDDDKPDKGPSE